MTWTPVSGRSVRPPCIATSIAAASAAGAPSTSCWVMVREGEGAVIGDGLAKAVLAADAAVVSNKTGRPPTL